MLVSKLRTIRCLRCEEPWVAPNVNEGESMSARVAGPKLSLEKSSE